MFSQDEVLQNSSLQSLDCASKRLYQPEDSDSDMLATAIKGCLEA
jgi:hypothetical protein